MRLTMTALISWILPAHAMPLDCSTASHALCQNRYAQARTELLQQRLTAQMVTDAPLKLLHDTEQLWLKRVAQCHSSRCVRQQIDQRVDDLKIYTSLNQSLTQHYLKYDAGALSSSAVHLKVHQLDKTRIKIEGIAYRNPNNRVERQSIAFLAYTTTEQKQQIHNNEQNCDYQFDFQAAILKVSSSQTGCERFTGIYRVYD